MLKTAVSNWTSVKLAWRCHRSSIRTVVRRRRGRWRRRRGRGAREATWTAGARVAGSVAACWRLPELWRRRVRPKCRGQLTAATWTVGALWTNGSRCRCCDCRRKDGDPFFRRRGWAEAGDGALIWSQSRGGGRVAVARASWSDVINISTCGDLSFFCRGGWWATWSGGFLLPINVGWSFYFFSCREGCWAMWLGDLSFYHGECWAIRGIFYFCRGWYWAISNVINAWELSFLRGCWICRGGYWGISHVINHWDSFLIDADVGYNSRWGKNRWEDGFQRGRTTKSISPFPLIAIGPLFGPVKRTLCEG